MRIGLWAPCVSVLLGLASLGVSAQAGEKKKHPHHHLHHALWELRDAKAELTASKANFGEHKDKALLAINDAIKQLELVLTYKGDNTTGTPTKADLKEELKKYKHHPHLHHAVVELHHAHTQLKEAKHDFNGHRKNAMRDIHIAITEIEALLKHHKKK
jgi:hypothetical protein